MSEPQGTDRWTKEGATPGEDPREIDLEQQDPERAKFLQEHRHVTNAGQAPEGRMGTNTDAHDSSEDD